MAFKSQEAIKQEIMTEIQGAENFDDMLAKISLYIQANFEPRTEKAEVIEDETELVSIT